MGQTEPIHSLLRRPASMRPPYSPWPEVMCFQAETSGVVLYTVKELKDAGRLSIDSVQKAYIVGVEGTKGKQSFGGSASTASAAFGRTSAHVFRMVMLEACGIDPGYWPGGGPSSYRNEDKLQYEQMFGNKFTLADSYEEAREYWCEFDKMYPHYLMEKFLEEKTGTLNNVMIIFKNYMQEMVEISMNVCANKTTGKKINCCVSATVVHRSINLEGAKGPWLDAMALAVRGTHRPLLQHYDMLLDLVSSRLSQDELEANLNIMYDSLPSTVSKIDDMSDCVQFEQKLAPGKEVYPVSSVAATRYKKVDTAKQEKATTKIETNIRTTNPITNEVLETKKIVTERTVTTSEPKGEIPEKALERVSEKTPENVREKIPERVPGSIPENILTEKVPEAVPAQNTEGPKVQIKEEDLLG